MPALPEVGADAVPEALRPHPALEGAQDGAALRGGAPVELLVHLGHAPQRLAHRARARQPVVRHGLVHLLRHELGRPRRRAPGVERLPFHEGAEGLLQPGVVPPRQRDQAAEPLLREVVGDEARHQDLLLVG